MQEASAGSLCMGCNSTSSLVSMFGALEMKNRVVGSQIRAIGSQRRAIYRAESQRRAKEAQQSDTELLLIPLLLWVPPGRTGLGLPLVCLRDQYWVRYSTFYIRLICP